MTWTLYHLGQLLTILLIAIALGMDAFSLGIGIGMNGIGKRKIRLLSSFIGLFHFFMPFIGIAAGEWLNQYMGRTAIQLGGLLLLWLGIHMVVSKSWGQHSGEQGVSSLWDMVLLAFGVSVDSLSVGFTMGLFSVNVFLSLFSFGFVSFLMSWAGLTLGRFFGEYLGMIGEIVGGLILIAFGVKFLA